ncbi:MAG: redoxin domain-containing protein [Cyclobacteriaceae bacterium]
MKEKISLVLIPLMVFTILLIYYQREKKFLLPTPVPENYQPAALQQPLDLSAWTNRKSFNKPLLLHFFNPDCPCSRFNLDHFRQLAEAYGTEAEFVLVWQSEDAEQQRIQDFLQEEKLTMQVIADKDKQLAEACGVYATPQAVIFDKNSRLIYRGNYNKSRFCTLRSSNYAQQAMEALLYEKPQPNFGPLALRAYGCSLPGATSSFSIFPPNLF